MAAGPGDNCVGVFRATAGARDDGESLSVLRAWARSLELGRNPSPGWRETLRADSRTATPRIRKKLVSQIRGIEKGAFQSTPDGEKNPGILITRRFWGLDALAEWNQKTFDSIPQGSDRWNLDDISDFRVAQSFFALLAIGTSLAVSPCLFMEGGWILTGPMTLLAWITDPLRHLRYFVLSRDVAYRASQRRLQEWIIEEDLTWRWDTWSYQVHGSLMRAMQGGDGAGSITSGLQDHRDALVLGSFGRVVFKSQGKEHLIPDQKDQGFITFDRLLWRRPSREGVSPDVEMVVAIRTSKDRPKIRQKKEVRETLPELQSIVVPAEN